VERFAKFKKISEDKKQAEQAKGWGAGGFPRWKPKPAWKSLNIAVNCVAIDASIRRADLPALAPGLAEVHGTRRCAQAPLLVVGCMQYMREVGTAPGTQHICDLIYVIGTGLPVIAASTWKIVGGDPKKLTHGTVMYHCRATKIKKKVFRYKRAFAVDHPEVLRALLICQRLPQSMWQCQLSTGRPLAALPEGTQLIEVSDLASLGREIIKARALEKGGCRAHGAMLS